MRGIRSAVNRRRRALRTRRGRGAPESPCGSYTSASMMAFSVGLGRMALVVFAVSGR
jgi:hypothetical protein